MTVLIKRVNIAMLLLLSLFLFNACSAKKTTYHKPIQNTDSNFTIVNIPNFSHTKEVWVPLDSVSIIPDMVAEQLRLEGKYDAIDRSSGAVDSDLNSSLIIKGAVIGYDPGCKFCEWFLGINDNGKSSVAIRVEFIDGLTGEVLGDVEIEGRSRKPGTGKSRYERVVEEIVSIVKTFNESG